MVGNSWHCGVARYLLALLVLAASVRTAATSATGATSGPPACSRPRSLAPWATCLDRQGPDESLPSHLRPAGGGPAHEQVRFVDVEDDHVAHLAAASALAHPFMHPAELELLLAFAVWLYAELGAVVGRWRDNVLQGVSLQLEDLQDGIAAWYRSLRPHAQGAYRAPASPVGVVAIPALRHLADVIAYPGVDLLCQELSVGFDFLGPITPGTGGRRFDGPSPPAPPQLQIS